MREAPLPSNERIDPSTSRARGGATTRDGARLLHDTLPRPARACTDRLWAVPFLCLPGSECWIRRRLFEPDDSPAA